MAATKVYRLSIEVRQLIIKYSQQRYSTVKIQKLLEFGHYVKTTRKSIRLFLKRYNMTGSIAPSASVKRKRRARKLTEFHKNCINMWLSANNELTSKEISARLLKVFNVKLTTSYVSLIRKSLGWTARRLKYCQLISHKNKIARVKYCLEALRSCETFHNVIFTDETSVELAADGRIFFYKSTSEFSHLPAKRMKPKHAYKVHVWGGISYRGRTSICIFTGIMDSVIYQKILEDNLVQFTKQRFPDGYRLYQDNDRKHTSKSTKKWMEEHGILENVMMTPASSPDLNPIENLWSTMKNFLLSVVKPKKKDELVHGIRQFWESVTKETCAHYIDHIHRVIPFVILNEGGPSGF